MYNQTILFVYWNAAVAAGCRIVSEVAEAAVIFNSSLPDAGIPPATMLMIYTSRNYPGTIGGPIGESYVSRDARMSDGQPAIDTVLVAPEDAVTFYKTFADVLDPVTATVVQDLGPWNRVFLSPIYRAFVWIMFAVNVVILLYALLRIARVVISGSFRLDLRTVVFVMGLLSAVFFVMAIPMRMQTWLRYTLELSSSALYTIAFYFLLFLWSGVLSRIQQDKSFVPFRVTVYVCLANALFYIVVSFLWLNMWPNDVISAIRAVLRIWYPLTQSAVALLFLVYAIRFNLRQHDYEVSKAAKSALRKLSHLCIIGFITFLLFAITNVVGGQPELVGDVKVVLAIAIVNDIGITVRGAAILLLLNVRVDTAQDVNSTGTWTMPGMTSTIWSLRWPRTTQNRYSAEMNETDTDWGVHDYPEPTEPRLGDFFSDEQQGEGQDFASSVLNHANLRVKHSIDANSVRPDSQVINDI
jgi:hypothetical protein